ncbi:MAG TPA: nucleoid occlusion factor SlmA [Burkholderiaceae bacterium]|nr:nucleoid occlusion factor SlmA [Burkholderiaceae bacterium]
MPASRRAQILDTLSAMLGQADAGRVTTAALAARLAVSEGALYRHFSGKAEIFEALIDAAEALIEEDLDHIATTEPDARLRLRKNLRTLRLFAERHPGLARVLTGHALSGEGLDLTQRADAVIDHLRSRLAQDAAKAGPAFDVHPDATARVLTQWILGCWQRPARRNPPRTDTSLDDELAFLGL